MNEQSSTGRRNLRELASGLDQIGIIAEDLDAIEVTMRALFGIEPKSRSENHYTDVTWRGQRIEASVGALFYDLFGIELEFLSPRGGPDIWQEFLDEHGPGLHHIRFAVEDHDATIASLEHAGVPVYQEGASMRGGGVRYAYLDARPTLGFFLEILSTPVESH